MIRQLDYYEDKAKIIQTAYESGEIWIYDPLLTGLRIAGYPNIDYRFPDDVYVFYSNPDRFHTTIIFVDNWLGDDSVRAFETRIDLVEIDGIWWVEWAGARWKCHTNRTIDQYEGWVTSLCP